ncbi:MAG: hypothetical protein H0V07_08050 [Propionibacteriales bacterium]|nr:hypothetical protein [Propionibacteriales bacterium]
MLVAASICPHPPLLLPGVSARQPGWLAELREVCVASVRRLGASGAEHIVAVGGAERAGHWGGSAGGDLRAFGVDAAAGGSDPVLPLALTVAAFLLDEAGWAGSRHYVAAARGGSPKDCAALGSRLVDRPDASALLVMGDGSAKRSTTAPGYLDGRAEPFDETILAALSAPSLDMLLSIDTTLADELWVAGREAWQVLAGAASGPDNWTPPITTWVRYHAAPLGVGYAVIDWTVEFGR